MFNVQVTGDAPLPPFSINVGSQPISRRNPLGPQRWTNGMFDHWQIGPSMPAPAAVGGYQCDFTGHRGRGSTVFVERQDFPLGQTDVPGRPRHFMRVTVNSQPGPSNYSLIASDFDGVDTFAGSRSTTTFFAKADAPRWVSVAPDQFFGIGGTPSADWIGVGKKVLLSTAWSRFDVSHDWPSVTGKTIGTDTKTTDRIGIAIFLEAGSSFNARTDNLGQQSGVFDFAYLSIREDPFGVIPSIPEPFGPYDRALELVKCQELRRVFTATEAIWSGYVEAGQPRWLGLSYPTMRRDPGIITVTKRAAIGFDGDIQVGASNAHGVQLFGRGSQTINSGYFQCDVVVDANHPYTP